MRFVKNEVNTTPFEDTVFVIVEKAAKAKVQYGKEKVVDATIGSLYDEEGKLVAFDSVFDPYNEIPKETKAKYAGSFTGNPAYRNQVADWLIGNIDCRLKHSVIATPGGTGAVNITISECLDQGETVILPQIAWGSYQLMATMANLKTKSYTLFEGDHFNLKSFQETCSEVMAQQEKLVIVINDPCHNPTGYSLSKEEWQEVIRFLNDCANQVPVVLLNDIAYIDYAYDTAHSRDYMEQFNAIGENVVVVIAFSCSKSLTSYGLRCGAALILGQNEADVRGVEVVFEKAARATWSNIANAAMDNFTYVTTENLAEYTNEKDGYVKLLKERSDIFTKEACEAGLPCYPYKEGFFVTIRMESNEQRDRYHEALMNELIFTVKVNLGIRVAVCSLSINDCKGLAKRMKTILDTCQ